MTQDEKWLLKYNEVVAFIENNKRNPSKHDDEERGGGFHCGVCAGAADYEDGGLYVYRVPGGIWSRFGADDRASDYAPRELG